MLRPNTDSNSGAMKEIFLPELTSPLRDVVHCGHAYLLKSLLKEKESEDTRPPLRGRRIAKGIVRWGPNCLKIIGDFIHIPLYWEWTKDVIARCSARLKNANIYDAVYASLYQYDREPQIVCAFCESWCPSTNTLHTIAGEWSLSLWDLHEIGGLPVARCRYDEAVPSFENMRDNRDKVKSIPRACERLLGGYCFLASLPESKNVVRATQWVHYWCKCKNSYNKPGREPTHRVDSRPKSSHNPRGEIRQKPLEWKSKEMTVFNELEIVDDSERKMVYLAAFLSCWLCIFVLPEAEDPVIRAASIMV
ncbi:hypothetical protein QQ045_016569 [Rhodiola kirilowii]